MAGLSRPTDWAEAAIWLLCAQMEQILITRLLIQVIIFVKQHPHLSLEWLACLNKFKMYNQQALDVSQAQVLVYGHKTMLVQLGVEDAVYKIAHKLIQNELMIHNQVDATVPFIVKSHLGVFGSVEGAGAGWGFLKLQHLGCSLQAVSLNKLPRFWSCAVQAVTGLHMAGVFHGDVKPGNMLIINNDLVLIDFDVSCSTNSTAATLQLKVGTEAFRSPLWKPEMQYRAI
ncbi:MAG: hypothetical protein FRX49_01029 [Trebouxia sp. A1-2]|nr:MAG: hypothetical protein FRX49_01029 [Trebouxia sp. A1-2]